MFKRILVPLDFTERNVRALEVVLRLALQNQSRVTMLHVIEKIDNVPTKDLKNFYERLETTAKEKMDELSGKFVEQNVPVVQRLLYGQRAKVIVNYAVRSKTDLIVLGSHKINLENPLQGWGTLSYKVAILSQCPVLLVK